ncbi:putative methionine aminopeptidase 1 protein [Lasiodiplodia theobromae]|uniref:Methionine aminopeptidase n=1 Tax=Lasiodiplodia theobromae TaxID=45133 RepID=A0A8H7IQR8_9PEZI|nr:putative methionine aminopeptidase 1 protein [Lasiodiplodia theobromae]
MATETAGPRKCLGADCGKDATALQCPTCQKLGKESYFCSQDCFKKNWSEHKALHKAAGATSSNPLRNIFPPKVVSQPDPETGHYNPFPSFSFTGDLRPVYPLSPRREVPKTIPHPDYAKDGIPKSEQIFVNRHKIKVLDAKEIEGMRKVCRLAREVLDEAARAAVPGVTTDYIDEVVHKACVARNSYPSPLNYCHFPKSVCTSLNEIICHGIPDQRVLQDGDILNIDVTLYHEGFHGDINETYYIGEKALADADSIRVVETARDTLDEAIKIVKPGMLFRDPGNVIEKLAKQRNCSVIKTYCGHGINQLFHCPPNVPHYAKNKAVGTAKPGMCFTIEPMIALGTHRDKTWPDDWTSATQDGKRTAQFEHTLLVTEDGVEVLTARLPDSPGGPVPIPGITDGTKEATNGA